MSRLPFDAKLVAIDDSNKSLQDFDDEFARIADVLLNKTELIIAGSKRFVLAEIEFYYNEI